MIEKESNYIQQIYRIILFLIGLWFINLIWPYISDVILMLVFAFLFTTVLLSSVDAFERRIGNRGLSVLGVVIILLGGVFTFLGSFISQISQQAQDFSQSLSLGFPTFLPVRGVTWADPECAGFWGRTCR